MAAQAPIPACGAASAARRHRRQSLLRRLLIRGGRLTRIARRAVGCAGAGLLALSAAAPAQAQGCQRTAPGTFECTGPITQAQSLSAQNGPLAATLSGDEPVNVLSGTALTLTGDDGVSLLQASGTAPIRGAEAGVRATLQSSGRLTITLTGSVTGGGQDGIRAEARYFSRSPIALPQPSPTRSISIAAATVTGAATGIYALNFRAGKMFVSATGSITGMTGKGILAKNIFFSNSTTISAASVSGADAGIHAVHMGHGDLRISATGKVVASSATKGVAILAEASHSAAGMSVDAASATAGQTGILALNRGTGNLRVAATGHIAGRAAEGIRATNERGVGVTVAAASVDGATHGIAALSGGTGDLSVSATGPVTGRGGDGIRAFAKAGGRDLTVVAASVTGVRHGIFAGNLGTGATSVSATGMIASGGATGLHGVLAYNNASGTGVSVSVGGARGSNTGITARNDGAGSLIIAATGSVTGGDHYGINASNSVRGASLTIAAADVRSARTGIDARNLGTGTLTVTATGFVRGDRHDGIAVRCASSATGLTVSAAHVSGHRIGISADHYGSGDLSVTATGMVQGSEGWGIYAYNNSGAESLTIAAASVTGGIAGITAINLGTGATSITATGHVESTITEYNDRCDGITVEASHGNVAVTAASVTGQHNGILVTASGAGDLSVAATGTVRGVYGDGINALSGVSGTGLTISVASAVGAESGIVAEAEGGGSLSVAATGRVTGNNADGILARSGASGSNLTVSVASVTGSRHGIFADNRGTGSLRVAATGHVAGRAAEGIHATNERGVGVTVAAASVDGATHGIAALSSGTGDLSITATGSVTGGSGHGIHARNAARGGSLTVSVAAVAGGGHGIFAANLGTGATSVSATGMVAGGSAADLHGVLAYNTATGAGVSVSVGGARGSKTGVTARNDGAGSLMVAATGSVTGASGHGIHAYNAARGASLTVSAAAVAGGGHGIFATNIGSGATLVSATGPVEGGSGARLHGIAVRSASGGTGMTVSAAAVSGHHFGISAEHYGSGDLSVTATGMVLGSGSQGIYAFKSTLTGGMTIAAASVTGGINGIIAVNRGPGPTRITATDHVKSTITAHRYRGSGINVEIGHRNVAVTAADVTGQNHGILLTHFGDGHVSITATGTVRGVYGDGLAAFSGIYSGRIGTIPGSSGTGIAISVASVVGARSGIVARVNGEGSLSVTATGRVTGHSADGVLARSDAGGSNLTVSVASVTGGRHGIFAENSGTGTTRISATGLVTADSSNGIFASNGRRGGSVTVTAATVTGSTNGILASNVGTGATSVSATGMVAGGSAAGLHGVLAYNTASGAGVSVSVGGARGLKTGVTARNYGAGSLMIAATGSVTGVTSHGIHARNAARGGSLTVSAAAVAGGGHGILATNLGSGTTLVSATGPVEGGSGARLQGSARLHGIVVHNTNSGSDVAVTAAQVRGAHIGIDAQNLGSGTLSITATGFVKGDQRYGIAAHSASGTTGLIVSAAGVSGRRVGISADHYGSGDLSVKATEMVQSSGGWGIYANSGARSGSLTIVAGSVTGGIGGITAVSLGTGATRITATGHVESTVTEHDYRFDGISVQVSHGHAAVTAADVTGQQNGIFVTTMEAGHLSVTATGTVRGVHGDGIDAFSGFNGDGIGTFSGSSGTGLTISAARVVGMRSGIIAMAKGGGSLFVAATGRVTGHSADGVLARSDASGSSLTISVASVTGGRHGIFAENRGTGATSVSAMSVRGATTGITARNLGTGGLAVTAHQSVTASSGTGIDAIGGSRGSGVRIEVGRVSGALHGIHAIGSGTGPLRVAATGDIVGGGAGHDGIHAQGAASGLDLMISAAASVTGGNRGILADNRGAGATFVSVGGPVRGGRGDGIAASGNGGVDIGVQAVEGRSAGVVAANGGHGSVVVTAADAVTGRGGGGIVATNGPDGHNLEISAAAVRGAASGIVAENFGSGVLSVAAAGLVASQDGTGIRAYSGISGAGLAISGRSVSAQGHGVDAVNRGAGDLSIKLTGDAESDLASGISARNSEAGVDLSVGAATAIGRRHGIFARNMGIGDLSVAVTGNVSGATLDGLYAYNGQFGLNLSIAAGSVSGFDNGVRARNVGNGALSVTVSSRAAGGLNTGIRAHNSASGTDLAITAGSASGRRFGIVAENRGHGSLSIAASGAVSGIVDDGLHAANGATGSDLTISATEVSGRTMGIRAENDGFGFLRVSATRSVSGGAGGAILARSGARGADVDIKAAAATGNSFGIRVRSMGLGAVRVAATGAVVGETDDGIEAYGGPAALGLTIRAAGVRGRERGIQAHLAGSGRVLVSATGAVAGLRGAGILARSGTGGDRIEISAGTVSGGTNGIEAISENRRDILISVSGAVTGGSGAGVAAMTKGGRTVVTLFSGASADAASGVAIRNNDDSANVTAMAGSAIRGAVLLGGGADALAFDGGRLEPDAILDGGSDPASANGPESIDVLRLGGHHRNLIGRHLRNWERIVVEARGLVSFLGRQTLRTGVFHNHGTLSMRDGSADDSLTIDGSFAGGGNLVLDVDFALGRADRLTITGNALGAATAVTVSRTDGSESGGDGAIALIGVDGATAADAFALFGGELRSGSRAYRLAYLTDRRQFALVPAAASAAAKSAPAQAPATVPKAAAGSEAAIGALPSIASALINPAPAQASSPVPAAPTPSAQAPAESSPKGGISTPNVAKAAAPSLSQVAAAASVQAPRPAGAAANDTAAPPSAQGASPAEHAPAPVAADTGASSPAPAAAAAAPAAMQSAKAAPTRASGNPAASLARESAPAPAATSLPSARPASVAATALPAPLGAHASPPMDPTVPPAAPAQTASAAAAQTTETAPAHTGGDPAATHTKESTAAPTAPPMRANRAVARRAQSAAAQPGATDAPQAAKVNGSESIPVEAGPGIAATAQAAPAARAGDSPAASPVAATAQGAEAATEAEADTRTAAPARARADSAGSPDDGAAPSGAASAVFLRMASIALLEGFAEAPTHLQRRWESGNPGPGGAWMLTRDSAGGYADTTAGAIMATRGGSVQGGTILAKIDGQSGDWIFGAKARRAHLNAVVHERGGAGSMESRGYGTGATATWLGRAGAYLDLQAQISRIHSEFLTFGGNRPTPDAKSRIYGTSIEAGGPIPLREGLTALPHAQIGWSKLESTAANGSADAPGLETGETVSAHIGLGLELQTENIAARLTGSLLGDFSDVPGDGAHSRTFSASRAEFGVGATFLLGGGALLVKATHRMPLDSEDSGGGSSLSAGMRWNWN